LFFSSLVLFIFFLTLPRHPSSTLFPYTTLFRSIATVVRISLRYRRLSQLEEGYGLIMSPLEKLARTVYADDPAGRFKTRGTGLRSEEHTSELQSRGHLVCRLLLEKKKQDK